MIIKWKGFQRGKRHRYCCKTAKNPMTIKVPPKKVQPQKPLRTAPHKGEPPIPSRPAPQKTEPPKPLRKPPKTPIIPPITDPTCNITADTRLAACGDTASKPAKPRKKEIITRKRSLDQQPRRGHIASPVRPFRHKRTAKKMSRRRIELISKNIKLQDVGCYRPHQNRIACKGSSITPVAKPPKKPKDE